MVNSLVRIESDFIQSLRYEFFFTPVNVPVIVVCLLVLTIQKRLLNAIDKKGFKLHFRTYLKGKGTSARGNDPF